MSGKQNGNGTRELRPQIQIWDDEGRETAVGLFDDGEAEWNLLVVFETVTRELVSGRLSFRSGDERYDTAPVLVEDTPAAVVRRATQLPHAMLRQLLVSARN